MKTIHADGGQVKPICFTYNMWLTGNLEVRCLVSYTHMILVPTIPSMQKNYCPTVSISNVAEWGHEGLKPIYYFCV